MRGSSVSARHVIDNNAKYGVKGTFDGLLLVPNRRYQVSLSIGSALMIGAMSAASASTMYYELFLSQGSVFGIGLAFV